MKILLVSPYFLPKIGGLENYVFNIAKLFRDKYGYEVVVVTSNHEGRKRSEDIYDGIRVIRLPTAIKLSNTPVNPFWYFYFRRIIKQEKPDFINAHSPVPFIADMAVMAARKTPVILTYHSGSMKKSSGLVDMVLGFYETLFLPMLLRRASAIATVYPEFIEQKLRPKDAYKVFYAPPAINPLLFKPSSETLLLKNKLEVLYVGKVHSAYDWKGLSVLLESMRLVTEQFPSAHLTVVGEGDAISYYQNMAKGLGLQNAVTFKGGLRGPELAESYQRASVLVLPSISDAEAFGTVLIEAMACGTPVIASNIGGMPRVIETTGGGLLVEPGAVEELADTIGTFHDQKVRQRLADQGLQSVREKFLWANTTSKYIHAIEAITAAEKRPRIIQLTPYYPPHLGGMENVVQEIARELSRKKQPVQVITSTINVPADYQDITELKGKVVRLKSVEFAHLPIIWNLLPRLLLTPRRSIFHVHIAQAFFPEIALLAAKLKGSRFIAHFHLDVAPSGTFGFVFSAYKKLIFPFTLRAAEKVIVFSEAQKQLIITKYGVHPEKAIIIPNGVRLEDYNSKRKPKQKDQAIRMLYVGRLSPQKRVDRLIEAMQYLEKTVRLDIVGSGETEGSLKATAKTLGLQNVHFHGARFGKQLIDSYGRADLFLLASDREGMPLVLLEAMAAGLPIIASDVVGNHELLGNVGVLVPAPYKPSQFADAIRANSSQKKLAELAAKSRAEASKYSWKVLVEQLEKIYTETRS